MNELCKRPKWTRSVLRNLYIYIYVYMVGDKRVGMYSIKKNNFGKSLYIFAHASSQRPIDYSDYRMNGDLGIPD